MAFFRICVATAVLLLEIVFAAGARAPTIRVDVTPGHAANTIKPTEALGAGIDRLPYGAADKLFVDDTIKQILSAGWRNRGIADPDGPALKSTLNAGSSTNYTFPAASVTVLRGALAATKQGAK
jgi:hypothetical protein